MLNHLKLRVDYCNTHIYNIYIISIVVYTVHNIIQKIKHIIYIYTNRLAYILTVLGNYLVKIYIY